MEAGRRVREHDPKRKPLTAAERRIVTEAIVEFDAHLEKRMHMTIDQFVGILRDLRDTVVPWVNDKVKREKDHADIALHVKKNIAAGATWAAIVGMLALAMFGAAAFWAWITTRFL